MKTISNNEIDKIMAETFNYSFTPAGEKRSCRNRLIILLMLDAGLRVGECVKLRIKDLIFNDKAVEAIRIRESIAKNNYERVIPTTERLRESIERANRQLWYGWPMDLKIYAIFKQTPENALTVRQVQRVIKAISYRAINRHIHPHSLRHTFATRMMRIASIRVVQELLGHKSIQSTQVYTHPGQEDLKNAISKLDATKEQTA